jgi:hypothetical protein
VPTIFGVLGVADCCAASGTDPRTDQGAFAGMAGLISDHRASGGATEGTDHGTALSIRASRAGAAGGKAGNKGEESKGLLHGSIVSEF